MPTPGEASTLEPPLTGQPLEVDMILYLAHYSGILDDRYYYEDHREDRMELRKAVVDLNAY